MSRQVAVVTGMPIPERRSMNTTVNAGLYMRLSVEDETNNESTSIQTQRAMLTDYCREKGFCIVDCYVDDGETGTNFERPEFQRMLRDIEAGKINTVICKDLSRFGRNYYEAGMYLDKYFVERKIRFIAIQDNVDSAKGSSGLTVPVINVMNDYYARSISEKTKAAKQTRAKQGMYLGSKAPYGYQKDPKDPHHLIVDPQVANIVCRMFDMAEDGAGYFKIAKTLQSEGIPTPKAYADGTKDSRWHITSVQKILQNPVYCGDCVQGRRGNLTMHGKQIQKPEDEWITVENTHEPLITREQWATVQKQLQSRKRSTKKGDVQMFAGLLFCADCGSALSFCVRRRKTMPDGGEYKCWRYMRYGKEVCTSHYITLDQISEVVLEAIHRQAIFAKHCRTGYRNLLMEAQQLRDEEEMVQQKEKAEQAQKRMTQLDLIIRKLLEQNAMGVISDERFASMMKDYEAEQTELQATISEYEIQKTKQSEAVDNIQRHIELVEKYTDIKNLNARILNRLIDRIEVSQRRKDKDGCPTQMITIYFRFIGKAELELMDMISPALIAG